MEPPNNMLEETPKVVPEEVGNKVVLGVMVDKILKTISMPPDPVLPDGVVGWVRVEVQHRCTSRGLQREAVHLPHRTCQHRGEESLH